MYYFMILLQPLCNLLKYYYIYYKKLFQAYVFLCTVSTVNLVIWAAPGCGGSFFVAAETFGQVLRKLWDIHLVTKNIGVFGGLSLLLCSLAAWC